MRSGFILHTEFRSLSTFSNKGDKKTSSILKREKLETPYAAVSSEISCVTASTVIGSVILKYQKQNICNTQGTGSASQARIANIGPSLHHPHFPLSLSLPPVPPRTRFSLIYTRVPVSLFFTQQLAHLNDGLTCVYPRPVVVLIMYFIRRVCQ